MSAPVSLFDCRLDVDAQASLTSIFASGQLASGPSVAELERRLEDLYPGRIAVAVSNLTQAIALALRLSDVAAGDEVLTLALNCMASNSAVALVGATPVWADINPETLAIDIEDCARAATPMTRALVAYHLAGYPSDLGELEQFCLDRDIVLIEDANAAFGAKSDGRAIGTAGRFSVLSFYANRQVNAIDGAVLLCARREDAERARRLRRFGVDIAKFRDIDGEIVRDLDVPEIGIPASMTNVSAKLACHQLGSLDARLAKVRENAAMLRDNFLGTDIVPLLGRPIDDPAYWVFFVRCAERDVLMKQMKAQGIECSRLHQRNDRYSGFGAAERNLPGTDIFEREMLALPVGWWLTAEQRTRMIAALRV